MSLPVIASAAKQSRLDCRVASDSRNDDCLNGLRPLGGALSFHSETWMPDPLLDVLCIGNAIVDVIANASDDFLSEEGLTKGSMRLIDPEEAERPYSHM